MATVSLSQALQNLESGSRAPVYLVVGEEPFQASEFAERLRKHLLRGTDAGSFNYDVFDADTVAPVDLLASLDTLPGLFDDPGSTRLVVCRRFEKAPALLLERLEGYFKNPAPQTCFLILAEKVDKRKTWFKELDKCATILEVADPHDREWPRWRSFFERRCGKNIEPAAWELLVEAAQRSLALVATECEKAALYVGEKREIHPEDIRQVSGASFTEDIFQLSEDIVARRAFSAMVKLHRLQLAGESEIKILAILVRHFRQVAQCLSLLEKGIRDPKVVGPQIGVPPFFVSKIQDLARGYTPETVNQALARLADCDYHLKMGQGTLWTDFLAIHFASL